MATVKNDVLEKKKIAELPILGKVPENEAEEKYLREIVEYEFNNIEEPGGSQSFPYGSTKNYMTFSFAHGEKSKVPRHVARHVESCTTPIYTWKPDGSGKMVKTRNGTKSRFQMRPTFS